MRPVSAGDIAKMLAKNLRNPRAIPEKINFRLRLTPQFERYGRWRWNRAARGELAYLLSKLDDFARTQTPLDRFAPIFAGWTPGPPENRDPQPLTAHYYLNGRGHTLPLPAHLPATVRRLVEEPELGSSKSKVLPIFYELGRLARSVLEAGAYTGVSSTTFLSAQQDRERVFIGTDIIIQPLARERLQPFLGPTNILFEAPIQAVSLPRGSLDVLFLDMVHKLENLVPTLEHVLDWLAPGGVLIIDDVGYEDSLYTPESLEAQRVSLKRGVHIAELSPLVLAPDAYRHTKERGHVRRLTEFFARSSRKFRDYHVPDGGGTVFYWEG